MIYNLGFGSNKYNSAKKAIIDLAFPFIVISKMVFNDAYDYIKERINNCKTVSVDFIEGVVDFKYLKVEAIICINAIGLENIANYSYSSNDEQYTVNASHLYQTV